MVSTAFILAFVFFLGPARGTEVASEKSPDWIAGIVETANTERVKRQLESSFCPNPLTRFSDSDHPTDCFDILRACAGRHRESGIYEIKPYGHDFTRVYCDMDTDGGGWTVFQRRQDGGLDFYRPWSNYKEGFGNLNSEFWLGNDDIHSISTQGDYELRIDLTNSLGTKYYATYQKFKVGDELADYILLVGQFSGNAGDSLTYANRLKFSTYNSDNDDYSSYNQASRYRSAWWFSSSIYTNLNGNYYGHSSLSSLYWQSLPGDNDNIKFTEMKMRPMNRHY